MASTQVRLRETLRDAQILPSSPGHLEHHAPLACLGAKFRERYLEFTHVPTVYRSNSALHFTLVYLFSGETLLPDILAYKWLFM